MQNHDYLNGETVATLRQSDIIAHMPHCIMPLPLPGKHPGRQPLLRGAVAPFRTIHMVFEKIIRSSPRRRASPWIAEGVWSLKK
jgi:hypothetical protein